MTRVWASDVPTAGTKILQPAPRAWQALSSQGYSFNESIADLIDNSVDASATEVFVDFLRDGDRLVSLVIADNGHGMNEAELDEAMTVGGRQTYESGSLGMFGTGLKAASLSQAASVTVVTKSPDGVGIGRRWVLDHAKSDHRCDIVRAAYADELIDRYRPRLIASSGTVIRWDNIKDFPVAPEASHADRYLDRAIPALRRHLGLYLHRFISNGRIAVYINVQDVVTNMVFHHEEVEHLDPFAYPVSGNTTYPRRFRVACEGVGEVMMTAHIWTPKSSLREYKSIGSVMERQGIYLYRNDRLVQAGGWSGLRQPESHLALARVALDIPEGNDDFFRVTVKKSGVETPPAFAAAIRGCRSEDGRTTFDDYLADAESAYRGARRQSRLTREPSIPISKGLDPIMNRVFEEELGFETGLNPIAIRWKVLDGGELFELSRSEDTLWLNAKYRKAITGEERGGLNDAPLVKTLLYLVLYGGGILTSAQFGPRDKDNLQLWQTVLIRAAHLEMKRWQADA